MRELFSIDLKNYNPMGKVNSRPGVRGIIEKGGKILVIHSKKYDYYMLPGGGKKKGETDSDTLIREIMEETGYTVIPSSIKEFGTVPRLQKDSLNEDEIYEQNSYYYFCDVENEQGSQKLEDYEAEEGFELEWVDPFLAYNHNKYHHEHGGEDMVVVRREGDVLNLIDLEFMKWARAAREDEYIASLGNPAYFEMLKYVESILAEGNTEKVGNKSEINYTRFEHTKRVLKFAKKLYDMTDDKIGIIYDDLIIATIFHDVGRTSADRINISHAKAGVPITKEYLLAHGYDAKRVDYIGSLVECHSDKWRMKDPASMDRNLLMLMEADLLDDMGAAGIVMDCMITEKRNPDAMFLDCLDHIIRYTKRLSEENPMVTKEARALWEEKRLLVNKFTDALSDDIELSLR